jgi:ABC-type uncharacterized transport system permease subunit
MAALRGGGLDVTLGAWLAQTARIALPYVAAAMGGVWSERAGVPNVALEGTMLVAALGAVAGTLSTGSPWIGLFVALLAGVALQLVHAAAVLRGGADAIVSGIALNLFAAGATRFLLRGLYGSSSNSPTIGALAPPPSGGGRPLWLETLIDPVSWLVVLAAVGTMLALSHTALGLRVRAVGESPRAAFAAGVGLHATRAKALALAGAVAALGGAWLAFDQRQFVSGMSGGRGFIALAAVVVSGWRPGRAALYCVLFAAVEASQYAMQAKGALPPQILSMLPYLATLLALAGLLGRSRPPAALSGREG